MISIFTDVNPSDTPTTHATHRTSQTVPRQHHSSTTRPHHDHHHDPQQHQTDEEQRQQEEQQRPATVDVTGRLTINNH